MRQSIACLLGLTLASISVPAVWADTATGAAASTGKNIFSTGEDSECPMFDRSRGAGPGAKLRQALLGDTKDNIPDFRQVEMLPTLTLAQRRQLREMAKATKPKISALVEQLKKLKEARDTAGGAVTPEVRDQFLELRSQMQALRKDYWEQSKTILTDSQVKDIQAMKHGELEPATFRDPSNNGEMMHQ